jgi:hydrogenase-4 component F
MPPFGIFRSEFEIVQGGFAASSNTAAAVLIVLVTLAFLGLSAAANKILLTPRTRGGVALARSSGVALTQGSGVALTRASGAALTRGEPSAWMVIPVVAGVIALLVLGVHPPAELTGLLARAVHQIGVPA